MYADLASLRISRAKCKSKNAITTVQNIVATREYLAAETADTALTSLTCSCFKNSGTRMARIESSAFRLQILVIDEIE